MYRPCPRRRAAAAAVVLLAALLTPALAPGTAAAASTRYLAPDGSDAAAGTEDAPWGTFDHALRQLGPGDTLYVRGGEYRELVTLTPYAAGQPDARVTVAAYPGEQPLLRGRLAIRDAHYWTFDGIDVTADPQADAPQEPLVKIMGGTGWVFRGARVWDARAFAAVYVGVTVDGGRPAHWRLEDNCIHDTHAVHDRYQDHNVYVQNGRGSGPGTIQRNVIFGAPNGNNVKVGGSGSSTAAGNVTLRYNTLYGASQNVLVALDTPDVRMERNIVGPRTVDRDDYPNVRGYGLTAADVEARDNVGFGAPEFIRNTPEDSTLPAPPGVHDRGGNRFPVDPGFASGGCGGFVPTAPHALAYGHLAGVERRAGIDRVGTSVALARSSRPDVGATRTVVLARADAYPDALAGAPLAARLGAPLLLTGRDALHPAAEAEIRRLAPKRAVVLGGDAAVRPTVVERLAAMGVTDVRRIAGSDRFHTAGEAAREVGGDVAYLVEGANQDPARGWPDAVSVSALAAGTGTPVLLTGRDTLPGGTASALADLEVGEVVIVGGTAAVSQRVEEAVADLGIDVGRIAGASRYDTSRLVAEEAVAAGADPSRLWLATGENWPDALAAGPAAAAGGGVLLLTHGTHLERSPAVRGWVRAHASGGGRLALVGGRGVLSPAVEDVLARDMGPRSP